MNDFNNNVLNYKDEFWKLDEGIVNKLILINQNQKIQTLYSKNWHMGKMSNSGESYLMFTYTEDLEEKLFKNLIPKLNFLHNIQEISNLFYQFEYPKVEYSESIVNLGCCRDKGYFNVNRICLNFYSHDFSKHNEFWDSLVQEFSSI